ncbi:substrate-binding periplasmic protein [Motiliproteus sediminis]|uniref:substrate-binding periplasmic protein n=1 Tax=Motiliproteus sediminis TaxID=1468178 RepID=UPI001AEFC1E3|nr:transporter substrate-binding domain-containing protein [Motiliproteus sediminis]
MNRSYSVTTIVLLLALLVATVAQARSYDDVVASGYLKVAVYDNYPPYSFMQQGEPRGVDVEIAKALAAGLGVRLELSWMIPDESLDDDLRNYIWKGPVLEREADATMLKRPVADVMMRVPYDREFAYKVDPDGRVMNELVHFFGPYQREQWVLGYHTERMDPFENLAVFQYDRVGVEIDSLPDLYLSGAFRGSLRENVVHFNRFSEAFDAMIDGQVSAVMGQRAEVEWGMRLSSKVASLSVPLPNLYKPRWDIGMAVRENYRQLAYALGDTVERLVLEGDMAALFDRYGLVFEAPDYYLQAGQRQ